ncbi:MAG: thiazolylpeptide-type bacteriocin [Alphaproteobacteria bacterium]|nr:thiazolylpeptide-type bacteriocin [Alphaproteobacteria bacterium]MBV9371504.1 thiazolylpeptide-type bacteriocin [Alphaproteobacteria bacterium]MBV9902754.1 thiazolylpeptide-type bacteriocin [Alphaproteobacteria bacterium]
MTGVRWSVDLPLQAAIGARKPAGIYSAGGELMMKEMVSKIDLSGIDLTEIDLLDVQILQAADTMAVPETGASPAIIYSCSSVYSCSCSTSPNEPNG